MILTYSKVLLVPAEPTTSEGIDIGIGTDSEMGKRRKALGTSTFIPYTSTTAVATGMVFVYNEFLQIIVDS